VSAGDLVTLYIGLELNSLSAYVLAAFLRSDSRSAEAGLKYFVLGALASGILLFGMSLTYGFTGTTSFVGVAAALDGGLSTGALLDRKSTRLNSSHVKISCAVFCLKKK